MRTDRLAVADGIPTLWLSAVTRLSSLLAAKTEPTAHVLEIMYKCQGARRLSMYISDCKAGIKHKEGCLCSNMMLMQ